MQGILEQGVRVGRSENWGADDTNTITGTFTSDATATANNIISGKTAYVNGQKITGNIPTMNGSVGDSGSNAFTVSKDICKLALYNNDVGAYDLVFPRGYYDGVKTNRLHIPNLLPQNIVSGVKVGWEGNSIIGTGISTSNVATLTMTDINLVTTTADGSGLIFTVDLSSYLNGLSHYIVECNGTCYAYSTSTVASYAVVTPYSSFIKYKDSYAGDVFKVTAPDPTKIIFYRRTNSSYKCTSINFTVRITGF